MAFAVSEDHARQEQVLEQLSWNRSAHLIRRAMTESKVPASDRRAMFIGTEAYAEAGGATLRYLFTEDGGVWFEDVGLLNRLVAEKLSGLAEEVREREGWNWAQGRADYPHGLGLSRVYPHPVERSAADRAAMSALAEEFDALVSEWDAVEELPPEVEARFKEIDAALGAFGDGTAFDPDEVARGGVLMVLGQDGQPRFERGLIRPEDAPSCPAAEDARPEQDEDGRGQDADPGAAPGASGAGEADEEEPDAPIPERLVLDLTARRTLALRDALAAHPETALTAVIHGLALIAFYPPYERASCLEIKGVSTYLESHAPGIADSPAGQRIAERHEAWAVRLPKAADDLWAFVGGLGSGGLLGLPAHCAGLTVNSVRSPLDRRPAAWAHADRLAEAVAST
jgi:ParB family chromosome partitioning protein